MDIKEKYGIETNTIGDDIRNSSEFLNFQKKVEKILSDNVGVSKITIYSPLSVANTIGSYTIIIEKTKKK